MMDRNTVDEKVLGFLRADQRQFTGYLKEMQDYAAERRMPIIPHETAVFLDFFLRVLRPKRILEVGTAIGFSAGLMAAAVPEAKIDTVDRYKLMIDRAEVNFEKLGVADRVTLIAGDAEALLPEMEGAYDFVFLDCAKSKYITFLPDCLRMLNPGGVIMIDDIFQGGTTFDPPETRKHTNRRIHQGLNELLEFVNTTNGIVSTAVPLGDGVLLVAKDAA
jgi:predicted O-methyltransferase YrrM